MLKAVQSIRESALLGCSVERTFVFLSLPHWINTWWCRRIPACRERQERQAAFATPPSYQSLFWWPWMPSFKAERWGQRSITTRQIQRPLDDAAKEVGIQETRTSKVRQRKRITPHLLRHSFSRWSLDAGIDISYLQQQLGHSSLTTTAIYLQARPSHRRKASNKAGFINYSIPVEYP